MVSKHGSYREEEQWACRELRQEDCSELGASLGFKVRPSLKTKTNYLTQ